MSQHLRYWVCDEDGRVFRKFVTREEAERFLQPGWSLVVQPRPVRAVPTVEEHGEARW